MIPSVFWDEREPKLQLLHNEQEFIFSAKEARWLLADLTYAVKELNERELAFDLLEKHNVEQREKNDG